ncbi:hypothetical protein DFH06DRAFT_1347699 [Mycena polygramma]|nr:hypothetical protein DFH06DRAFT_1348771 [Mycena polygramma]KAJ7607033.1 hypothetical protein DFH06DRAFT_1347699 [Mycena polygramma]
MGKTSRRGKHSAAAKAARKSKYMAPGGVHDRGEEKRRRITEVHAVSSLPGEFLPWTRDNSVVTTEVAKRYPGDPAALPNLSEEGGNILLVPMPKLSEENLEELSPSSMPKSLEERALQAGLAYVTEALNDMGPVPFLLMRCTGVLSEAVQAILWQAWRNFVAAGGKASNKKEEGRSVTPGYHFGIWSHYSSKPFISADSRQMEAAEKDRPRLILLLDIFLELIKRYLVPKVRALLAHYAPQQLQILHPVYQRVQTVLGAKLAARPALDWEGVFFAAAVKEGSSELVHIDWNDAHALLTFIFVASEPGSEWEGGEFCCPQLGYKIPFRGGQVIAARTRMVAHCGATVSGGGRLVVTCFSDNLLLEHALFGTAKGVAPAVVVIPSSM